MLTTCPHCRCRAVVIGEWGGYYGTGSSGIRDKMLQVQ